MGVVEGGRRDWLAGDSERGRHTLSGRSARLHCTQGLAGLG